jgi:hypothetical protein
VGEGERVTRLYQDLFDNSVLSPCLASVGSSLSGIDDQDKMKLMASGPPRVLPYVFLLEFLKRG